MLKHDQEFYRQAQEKNKKQVIEFVNEEFRENPKYPNYAISNMGRVYNDKTDRMMKPSPHNGYLNYNVNGKTIRAHRLVAETFVPKQSEEYNVINHKNCDKQYNCAENLEWCTQRQNIQYSRSLGNLGSHSLQEIEEYCKLIQEGYTSRQIAEIKGDKYDDKYGTFISAIRTGKSWSNISKKYDFSNMYRQKEYTTEQKHHICQKIAEGKNARTIANEMNIPYNPSNFPSMISKIARNKMWHDIVNQYNFAPKVEPKNSGGFHRNSKNYSEETVRAICQMIADGKYATEIAKSVGLDTNQAFYSLLCGIKEKKKWKFISDEYF